MGSLAAALAVLAGLAPATVAAQPRSETALIWQAPVGCPDATEVRARIERRLGMPLDHAVRGVEIAIEVNREASSPKFVARIDLRGVTARNEVRVLTSARCDELTDAVAVIVARIATEVSPPPAEVRSRPSPSAITESLVTPRPWGAGLRLFGVSGIGVVPGVGVGGELAGYVRSRSRIAELAASVWYPGIVLAALRAGWGPEHVPLRAWMEAEVGWVYGDRMWLGAPRPDRWRWTGVGAGFAVAWPMSLHTRLVGTIEVVVPVQRARFVFPDGRESLHPGLVTVRSGLGLEVGWR